MKLIYYPYLSLERADIASKIHGWMVDYVRTSRGVGLVEALASDLVNLVDIEVPGLANTTDGVTGFDFTVDLSQPDAWVTLHDLFAARMDRKFDFEWLENLDDDVCVQLEQWRNLYSDQLDDDIALISNVFKPGSPETQASLVIAIEPGSGCEEQTV